MTGLLGPDGHPIQSDLSGVPLNANWLHWANRWVDIMYNPDTIPLTEYERIYNTDETVFSGCQFMVHSILSRLGEYEHENEEIEAFVRRQFQQMYGSAKRAFAEVLSAVYYGFSVSEMVFRKDGKNGKGVGLAAIQTLHPQTIAMDLHKDGPLKNRVSAFWQHYQGADAVQIPANKVIHFVHEGAFGNPYGCPRLKRAWKSMFIKDVLLRAYGTCLERYGTPIAIGTANLTSSVRHEGVEYTGAAFVGKMLDSLGKTGSLILPMGATADIKYAPGGLGTDFLEAIRYCNRSIHQAIGLPSLIADAGSVGSYSLGQEHAATFERLLENILDDLIECLLDQLVRPLIETNFGPQEDYGDFQVDQFDAAQAKLIAEVSKLQVEAGLVDMNRLADMNHHREINGLPPLTEEDLSPDYPAMIPSQQLPDPEDNETIAAPQPGNEYSLLGKRQRRLARKLQRSTRHARCFKPLPREALAELQLTG